MLAATASLRFAGNVVGRTALLIDRRTAHVVEPRLVVVVAINPRYAKTLGMSLTFMLANLVFLTRKDIGIVMKNSGAHTMLQQPLDDG